MKNKRTYEALKKYGFSAPKAVEILVEARRGGKYALLISKMALKRIRSPVEPMRSMLMELAHGGLPL